MKILIAAAIVAVLSGCALAVAFMHESARLPLSAGFGPQPQLPEPHPGLLPTVNIAPAVGWRAGEQPVAAPGLGVTAFATGLDHPRNVYVLPNGDVLVAETNTPAKPPDEGFSLRRFIARHVMARTGAGVASPNRIILLRDAGHDGVAETRTVFLQGLNSPYGIALIGNRLFVADTDAIRVFPYHVGQTRIDDPGTRLAELPAGPINSHWTKNVVASGDGRFLYVGIGSNSNIGDRGLAAEQGRAQIWEVDARSGEHRVASAHGVGRGKLRFPRSGITGSHHLHFHAAKETDCGGPYAGNFRTHVTRQTRESLPKLCADSRSPAAAGT